MDRTHIKVKSVGTTKPVRNSTITTFLGEDGVTYEFWGSTFTQYVQVGKEFDADVEHTEKKVGTAVYHHNTITQIYVDGKPVGESRRGPGGGYGRSAESIKLEYEYQTKIEMLKRTSIEGQTAMNQIGTLLSNPTGFTTEGIYLTPESLKRIMEKYWRAVEKSLDAFLNGKLPAKAEVTALGDKEKQFIDTEPLEKAPSGTPEVVKFENPGQWLTKVKEVFGLNKSQTLADPEVKQLFDQGEFGKAYLKLAETVAQGKAK